MTHPREVEDELDRLRAERDSALEAAAVAEKKARLWDEYEGKGHVAEFREDGYGLEHPPSCRLRGPLLDCAVNIACAQEQAPPGGVLGRYRVTVTPSGDLVVGEALEREGGAKNVRE